MSKQQTMWTWRLDYCDPRTGYRGSLSVPTNPNPRGRKHLPELREGLVDYFMHSPYHVGCEVEQVVLAELFSGEIKEYK